MTLNMRLMGAEKRIALIAHDNLKDDLLEWVQANRTVLAGQELYATGNTGRRIVSETSLAVTTVQSGPLGGDQQIGAMIVDGTIDILIFFWDPLESQPHDPDVKALLRIATVWNIPIATSMATADFLISSPLMTKQYVHRMPIAIEFRAEHETTQVDG